MWDLCVTECIAVQSVDSTGMCSICRLINSVLSVVRLLLTAMIKRDALKGRKPFQFTPDTSWMSSIHLDRNGRSFSSPRLILWLGPSQVRTHFSPALCLVPFIFVPCFSLSLVFFFSRKHSFSSLPFHFSLTLPVCRGFTSKLMIGFKLLSRQYFLLLCVRRPT